MNGAGLQNAMKMHYVRLDATFSGGAYTLSHSTLYVGSTVFVQRLTYSSAHGSSLIFNAKPANGSVEITAYNTGGNGLWSGTTAIGILWFE